MQPVNETRLYLLLIYLLVFPAGLLPVQQDSFIEIDAPQEGSVLQGVVSITGITDVEGFRSAEVAFAYQPDPTGTWFIIQQVAQPVKGGPLAAWDTSTITDGNYRLRLQVSLQDGRVLESVVDGLRVRNYTPVETATPAAGSRLSSPAPTGTPLPDFQVTPRSPTPLATNPAQLTPRDLQASMLKGTLAVFGALALAGIYLVLKAAGRR